MNLILRHSWKHFVLVVIAVLGAAGVAIALAVWCQKNWRMGGVVVRLTDAVRTVPIWVVVAAAAIRDLIRQT